MSTQHAATQAQYDEVGWLALQLLTHPNLPTVGDIHFALWAVFDPNALNVLSSTVQTDVSVWSKAAAAAVSADSTAKNSFISQFTVYSPDTNYPACSGSNCTVQPPQEFLVKTPEPPFFALLGVDLSGVGALVFLLRRRRTSRS